MTWLDLIAVVLLVLVAVVEAKRGAVPAAVDLCVGFVGLGLAKAWAPGLAISTGSHGTAFALLFGIVVLVAGLASTLVDTYTKWDIGPYDAAVAGVFGVVTGLVLGHGVFHLASVASDRMADVAGSSLLVTEIYELRSVHAIEDILRNLGGGKSIVDEVKESQE